MVLSATDGTFCRPVPSTTRRLQNTSRPLFTATVTGSVYHDVVSGGGLSNELILSRNSGPACTTPSIKTMYPSLTPSESPLLMPGVYEELNMCEDSVDSSLDIVGSVVFIAVLSLATIFII